MPDPTASRPAAKPLTAEFSKSARMLIGWVPGDVACTSLAGPAASQPFPQEITDRVQLAREAARARPPVVTVDTVISDPPIELQGHIAELGAKPFFQGFRAEGWRVCMADLQHVRALQWSVHTSHVDERTASANPADIQSVANITIPLMRAKELNATVHSNDTRTLSVTCRNPMMHLIPMQLPNSRGPVILGREDFTDPATGLELIRVSCLLTIDNSQVQVVRWKGAYFLRDGHHRALGLLTRGITSVPVLYREYADNETPRLLGNGFFDDSVLLGSHPAMLRDFLDDKVAADISVRATQRTFVFQVVEQDVHIL